MDPSQAATAKPPINRANVMAWMVIATLVLSVGGYLAFRQTPTVPAAEVQQQSGRFAVEGTVREVDAENKRINMLEYGGKPCDMFRLVDKSGVADVYAAPSAGAAPAASSHVRAVGTLVQQRGVGVLRFMADEITPVSGR